MNKPTISLVLSSGGARGLAHIGIIEWLDENGFDIQSIAGSSMGALIGGVYAAGKLDEYKNWVVALEKMDVIRLLDLSYTSRSLFKGERIIETLRHLIGDYIIEDLPVSYTAVATDIDAGREIWLNRGSLWDAIRASIAIPTIFLPVTYKGKRLVDGGLINPVPIAPTLNDKTDLTIAVNLSAKSEAKYNITRMENIKTTNSTFYHQRIADFIDGLQQKFIKSKPEEPGFFEVMEKSLDTMEGTIARFKLAAYSPDIIIDVPANVCAFYEFNRARELIDIGRQKANEALGHLAG